MKELKNITAPSLGSAQYGSQINDVMANIDENFKIIGNHDFVKGDRGDSIHLSNIYIKNDPQILEGVKYAIQSQWGSKTINSINGVGIWDWFERDSKITLIYQEVDGKDVLVSSLPYIFRDVRFEKSDIMLDDETDWSCVVYYENGQWTTVQEFPTLYFEDGFKWKINGVKTGLDAQGPRGEKGENGTLKIVRVTPSQDKTYMIEKLLVGTANGYEEITCNQTMTDGDKILSPIEVCARYDLKVGQSVIAMVLDGTSNKTYLSPVFETAGPDGYNILAVYCDNSNHILGVEPINDVKELCDKYFTGN